MPTWIGSFAKDGSPVLTVGIVGMIGEPKLFDAIIDTGFSGFVSMPLLQAFPLGLVLTGTTQVVLADGSTAPKLTAIGGLEIAGDRRPGVILLEPTSSDVLVGMEFLRTFKRTLTVRVVAQEIELVEDAPPAPQPSPPQSTVPSPPPAPVSAAKPKKTNVKPQ